MVTLRLVCSESVCCASGATYTKPEKLPCDTPEATPLTIVRDAQSDDIWLTSTVTLAWSSSVSTKAPPSSKRASRPIRLATTRLSEAETMTCVIRQRAPSERASEMFVALRSVTTCTRPRLAPRSTSIFISAAAASDATIRRTDAPSVTVISKSLWPSTM